MNARANISPTETAIVDESISRDVAAERANAHLADKSAQQRVAWALDKLPGQHVLSSSFGAQAAVSLHLFTQVRPDIPVVLIDTGYLFAETYRFIDALTARLRLNLKVYRADISPAWQEARYGQRWNEGPGALADYNEQNKVSPMRAALSDLDAGTWFAGLRQSQSATRQSRKIVELNGARWKVHPIVDWADQDVYVYLRRHGLPYHPLWEKGYVSIGDTHSTRSLMDVDDISETRFGGQIRECGLHLMDNPSSGEG